MLTSFMESRHWLVAGWTMLHFLWVGGLVGLIAGAGRRILGTASPNMRYAFALACLAALAAAPVTIALIVAPGTAHLIANAGGNTEPALETPPDMPDNALAEDDDVIADDVVAAPRLPSAADARTPSLPRATEVLGTAARYLPWVWLIGAPLVFMMAATGLAGAERLRRQSRVLDGGTAPAVCRRLLLSLRMTRQVALGLCDRVASPVLIGILRPMILLPPAALTGWSPEQLEMVLLHELTHVRRWDNLVNLLQRIVESFLFFHPVVWLVSHWVRVEREQCCDQTVLLHTGRPHAYARMLAALAFRDPTVRSGVMAMGEHDLVGRIRRVLKLDREAMKLSHKMVGLLTLAFVATTILLGAYARQSPGAHGTRMVAPSLENEFRLDRTPGRGAGAQHAAAPGNTPQVRAGTPDRLEAATEKKESSERPPADVVILRLVDADNTPVAGANVGLRARWKGGQPEFSLRGAQPKDVRSGEDGRVRLPWRLFHGQGATARTPVYVLHTGRDLTAIVLVSKASRGRELTVNLRPACRVRFRVDSTPLRRAGHSLVWTKGQVAVAGADLLVLSQTLDESRADRGSHDYVFPVPPGDYRVFAMAEGDGSAGTETVTREVAVNGDQRVIDLGTVDVPPARYSLLYGQPAPEFEKVKDLETGGLVRLAGLKGKVVLVNFPLTSGCREMEQDLRALYAVYRREGLVVVVIRSPSGNGASAATGVNASSLIPWWHAGAGSGSHTPKASFIRAVDGGGWTEVEGTSRHVLGATAAAYGIEKAGTLLLIDREGRLAERISLDQPDARVALERVLGLRRRSPETPADSIRFLVRDPTGAPVMGATVGCALECSGSPQGRPAEWRLQPAGSGRNGVRLLSVSDPAGRALLSRNDVYDRRESENAYVPVFAFDATRNLAGMTTVSVADLGNEVPLALEPACRVQCRAPSGAARVRVEWKHLDLLAHPVEAGLPCTFLLPPGVYSIRGEAATPESADDVRSVHVTPGMGAITVELGDPRPRDPGVAMAGGFGAREQGNVARTN